MLEKKLRPLRLDADALAMLEGLSTPMWVFDKKDYTHPWANQAGRNFFLSPSMGEFSARSLGAPSAQNLAETVSLFQALEQGERPSMVHTFSPRGIRRQARVTVRPAMWEGRMVALVEAWPDPRELNADTVREMGHWAHSPQAVMLCLLDGTLLQQNPAADSLLGSSEHLRDLLTDPQEVAKLLVPRRQGQLDRETLSCRCMQGALWLELTITRVPDPIYTDGLLLLEAVDVSFIRARQKALEDAIGFLQGVLNTLPLPTVVLDKDSRILLANPSSQALLGMSPEVAVGYPLGKIVNPPESLHFQAVAQTVLESGQPAEGEISWTNESGARRLSISVGRLDLESEPHLVVVATDLTEQYRTLDQLEEARVAAEAASQAKTEFLATVSHEIRTPLNGVLGLSALALESADLVEIHELLAMSQSSGHGLLKLIDDLLLYARLGRDKLTIEPEATSLAELLSGLRGLFEDGAREKGVALEFLVDPELPETVSLDGRRVSQVLINLVSNALKFTPEGQVSVRIVHAEQGWVSMEVQDTGIGITAEQLPSLFQAFTQADGSISRRFGGTGLGLAISRRLADAMGGSLEGESQVGLGSTFRLRVPAPVAERPSPASSPGPLPSLLVMLVEDNLVNQLVARRFLERVGQRVHVCASGEAALAEIEVLKPDLVLMDLHMPGLDGLETTRAMRSSGPCSAQVPIVAMTADGREE
ncbi:MAG: PAS domain S-box-containing protein, partial [Cognaticolwellia sp.]